MHYLLEMLRVLQKLLSWSTVNSVPGDPDQHKQTTLPREDQKENLENNILRAALFLLSDKYSIIQFGKQFIGALAAALYSSVHCTVFQQVLLELLLKIAVLICSS